MNLIKKLFGKSTYEEQRVEYLYHLVLAIGRTLLKPEELATKSKEVQKNIIYLSEVFKEANVKTK